MKRWLLWLLLPCCGPLPLEGTAIDAALAPPIDHGLAIGNWNIEWFGASDRGPDDDRLQLENASRVIDAAGVDLWVVAEISSPSAFAALLRGLPGRAGLLSSDPEVADGARHYSGDEQRVGLIYDSSKVTITSARLILADRIHDFAGRPPLLVETRLELAEGSMDLTVIAVHLKAFGDEASKQRRQRAAEALADFLTTLPPGRAALVAGDWNDGLERSTAGGESPFAALVASADLHFWTAELAASGAVSYAGGRELLDHQLANRALDAVFVPDSARLLEVDSLVADFSETTSDHFPVISRIDLHRAISINEILANEPGRDRSAEMVELHNTSCAVVRLEGLRVGSEGATVQLGDRTLAQGAALAVRKRGGLGLANGGGRVVLDELDGEALERVDYPASLAALDGVSMNRVPDGARTSEWRLHRGLGGRDSSPGTRASGATFGCP